MPNEKLAPAQQRRLALFLVSPVLILGAVYVLYAALDTLQRLDVIEAERDTWQRPRDVITALELHPGNVVVDLGSGAGYFALKLAPVVGNSGRVLAVDLRKLSLAFLWIRAASRRFGNLHVIVGDENDPRLPPGAIDAVLVVNTYHELSSPDAILERLYRALGPGGRLVIADRAADTDAAASRQEHASSLAQAEERVRSHGFEIVRTDNQFIDRPGDEVWWLLVARK